MKGKRRCGTMSIETEEERKKEGERSRKKRKEKNERKSAKKRNCQTNVRKMRVEG